MHISSSYCTFTIIVNWANLSYHTLCKDASSKCRTRKTVFRTVSIQVQLESYQCQHGHKLRYPCQNGHNLLIKRPLPNKWTRFYQLSMSKRTQVFKRSIPNQWTGSYLQSMSTRKQSQLSMSNGRKFLSDQCQTNEQFVLYLCDRYKTDEGQPRPEYIFNKCGTIIYFFYSTRFGPLPSQDFKWTGS